MQRKVVLVARLSLFLFCGVLGIYFLVSNLVLRESLKKISKATAIMKDKDSLQYKKLQEDTRRDLEEKYRADMVSYKVVAKRLELEKNKQKDLREETKKAEKIK